MLERQFYSKMTKKIPTIVTIGKATQDVFLKSTKLFEQHVHKGVRYEQMPTGQKLDLDDVIFATGGNVTNAAVTFARQGLNSRYAWCLGEDMASNDIMHDLDKEGIDTRFVYQGAEYRASYSVVIMLDGGERTILNYRGTMPDSKSPELNLDVIDGADWLYLSSLGDIELLERIVTRAKEQNVKVMLNPAAAELEHQKKLHAMLEDIEVLIVNKEEAQQIVEGDSLEELVRHAHNYTNVVIVSDGPNGAVAGDGKTIVEAGMYEDVPVTDRTGGGDAFGSGFLSQYSQGKDLKESLIFASANSTSVVQHIGAKKGILYEGVELHDMPITEKEF